MKNLRLIPASLALASLVLAPVAFAAGGKGDGPTAKTMAKYDLDKDGKLSADEAAALRADFAAAPTGDLARFDTDKDGKLSDDEIAKIVPGSGKKSDKPEKSEKKADGEKKHEGKKADKKADDQKTESDK
jgi:hypothetical protein